MKRVFIVLGLFIFSLGYSQTPVLEPGVYKANAKGQKLLLRIYEGNTYEMAIFYGNYTVEKDTILFKNKEPNESNFIITANKQAPFSSTLKIKLSPENFMYFGNGIYIGTQKEDNAVIEYKPMSDYLRKRVNTFGSRPKEIKIDVEKTKYIYFTDISERTNVVVTKFQIDPNVNEIGLEYNRNSLQNIQLKGVINPETKKLSIMEGRTRRDILEFEKEGLAVENKNALKPITVIDEKDWLKKNGFAKEPEFDSSYLEKRSKTNFTFKHTIGKTLAEALKNIEKTPEKFLVVVFDDRKESKKDFDQFIKNQEQKMSRMMRRGYNAQKDHFNFYLASEKDKPLFSKFKIEDKTSLLFLNAYGELLYHTDGTIDDNSNLFESYYSVYDEVKRASELMKLDKLIANKKTPLADLKKSLLEIIKSKKKFEPMDNESDVDSTVVEDVDYDTTAVVDTVAAVAPYDEDGEYLHVVNPENLYTIKTPKNIIEDKWKLLVDFYTKSTTYDEDFIEMCKRELLNNGFTYKLYGLQKFITETDFKILDYLFKNYTEIEKNEAKPATEIQGNEQYNEEYDAYNDVSNQNSVNGISPVLSAFFSKMTSESAHLHRTNQIKLIAYYKSFLQLSGYKLADLSNYLERIKETNVSDNALYYKEFDEFFTKLISKNPSLLETLDEMFTAQKDSYLNWVDFKHEFSRLANNVAWVVVESNNNDANTLQKALKWSEASTQITKNDFHYLDTLGQLYYKNNQKQKAIVTEQQAIDNLNPNDKERKESYTEVLEKMKNGTY